jgi:hypothetical protein
MLIIKRENRIDDLSCLCSSQEEWNLFFNHGGLISAPETRKRKPRALSKEELRAVVTMVELFLT